MLYVCELCGYEYNPKIGDPENSIAEGTDFEDLPADWECPLCGGKLLKKDGPYGEFFGCSNYKVNGCTYKRKIK